MALDPATKYFLTRTLSTMTVPFRFALSQIDSGLKVLCEVAEAFLADNVVEKAALTSDEDLRVLAAVLFGLAAQQGNEDATEALGRVVELEITQGSIQSQEEFESSAVVRTRFNNTKSHHSWHAWIRPIFHTRRKLNIMYFLVCMHTNKSVADSVVLRIYLRIPSIEESSNLNVTS